MPVATPSFVQRYLDGELADFFELDPGAIGATLAKRPIRPRAELSQALRSEAKRLEAPAEVFVALDRLAQPDSRVVVTGQQPGLLLGPAYTLSKAMSAIRLAGVLDSEDTPVVAVFWLAAQDHDTAEVDHARLLDFDERLQRLSLPLPAGVAAGRIPWRDEWRELLCAGLQRVGGRLEHVEEAQRLVESACREASTFADACAGLLYRLLGRDGLIILDPTRPALAPFFSEVLERELNRPGESVKAIEDAGDRLRELGLQPQLGRGREATNLFLDEDEGQLPQRRLLRFDGRSFSTGDREYGPSELLKLLSEEPWRITPAAGLRPITQDAVLPTAAFVVGPGELGYLAQLRGVYQLHQVQMPLAWPRATSVVLEPPARRILERYGLDYQTFERERDAVMERVLLERHRHAGVFERVLAGLENDGDQLLEHVAAIDPTLAGTVERGRDNLERTLELLRSKTAAALARNDDTTRRQFGRLEAQLFPGGAPQERVLSPFSFFLKFGCEPMMELYRTMTASGEHLLRP